MTDRGLGERLTAGIGGSVAAGGIGLFVVAGFGVLLGRTGSASVAFAAVLALPALAVGALLWRWATPERWPDALVGGSLLLFAVQQSMTPVVDAVLYGLQLPRSGLLSRLPPPESWFSRSATWLERASEASGHGPPAARTPVVATP